MSDQPTSVFDPARPDLGGNVRHGDAWTYHPALWRYLVGRFGVRSVLDVGCGEGHAVRFFHALGVIAHGIDGLLINVQRAVYPIALHDLLIGPYIMPVDLVWSCEVAGRPSPRELPARGVLDRADASPRLSPGSRVADVPAGCGGRSDELLSADRPGVPSRIAAAGLLLATSAAD